MATITNLTGTSWSIDLKSEYFKCLGIFNVNGFVSSFVTQSFVTLGAGYNYINGQFTSMNGSLACVNDSSDFYNYWFDQGDGIVNVTFTGGNDVTNSKLISIVQTYGELLSDRITDLKGYTVTVPAGWTAAAGYGQFAVNCECQADGDSYVSNGKYFLVGYGDDRADPIPMADSVNVAVLLSTTDLAYVSSQSLTLSITDGDDVDNPSLIQWLYDNNATFEKTGGEETQTLTVINVNNESETATYEVSADTTFEDICVGTADWQVKFSGLGSDWSVFYNPKATSTFVYGYQLYSDSECTVAVNYSNFAIGTFYYKGEVLTTLTIWGTNALGVDDYVIKTYNVPVGITFEELANSEYNDGAFSVVGDDYKEALYNGLAMSMNVVGGNSPVAIGVYASQIANDVVDGVTYRFYGVGEPEEDTTPTATITYDGATVTLKEGQTVTFRFAEKVFKSDIVISVGEVAEGTGETTLAGTWLINDTISPASSSFVFTVDGSGYWLDVTGYYSYWPLESVSFFDSSPHIILSSKWDSAESDLYNNVVYSTLVRYDKSYSFTTSKGDYNYEALRKVIFPSSADSVENADKVLEWFNANAIKISNSQGGESYD